MTGGWRKWGRKGAGERGSVAVEYGIILPVLLMLTLGIIDMGRLIWTQTTLDRAVEAAARCGAVNAIECGTVAQLQSYAVGEAYGLTIQASDFTVSTEACGVQVAARYPFRIVIPWVDVTQLTLTATACYPV